MPQLIQLSFDKIMQTEAYTVIILGAEDKRFAIYTDPNTGKTLQFFLTQVETPRPLSHELFSKIFEGFNIRVKQVIITDVEDTVYFARLFLEQEENGIRKIIEIDARPSDSLIIALMANAPVYCKKEVMQKIVPIEE